MPSPDFAAACASVRARIKQATGSGFRWMGGYAKGKLASDPVYAQLCERIAAGAQVLDLGSGIGLLGLLLQELDRGHRVHGIEWDARKVAFAQRLTPAGSPSRVVRGDIFRDPWPPAEVVVLVDVLHYFPPALQRELLARIAHHLPPGGIVLLRTMDRAARGRACLTRLLERMAVALRWNRAPSIHWRSLEELQADLAGLGLRSLVRTDGPRLLDGNRLIEASKPR